MHKWHKIASFVAVFGEFDGCGEDPQEAHPFVIPRDLSHYVSKSTHGSLQ